MIKKVAISVLLLLALTIGYIFFDVNYTKINYLNLESDKIPKGESLKILQVSDMHNKKFPNANKKLFKLIRQSEADLIVITGDFIDGKTKDFTYIYSFVDKLVKINPQIYFVSGNHEWRTGRNTELVEGLKGKGVKVLNNRSEVFKKENFIVNICGVDDSYTRHDNFEEAIKGVNNDLYTVLLSHSPDLISRENTSFVDLILSGHTHGGQIRLPIIGALVAPGQGFFPKYDKGVFDLGSETKLYLDSGLGTSTIPIRFWNRSQISLITISR
ncbi:metallophosphoesterase [Sporosalibacterium faouarense]|uniref:metallophosphoesterase n=1 Tax=Sporosalibacterium faouarense TaxID=516123 RepID=UPI00141C691C|nr:metallophosphoesterase [Sporosalibacterium faouarense]MTI46907.1 metallophosphoesterase [Bacillota bacterium]MTI49885.1 metallophosphoesterase [Bacillota bacterium]